RGLDRRRSGVEIVGRVGARIARLDADLRSGAARHRDRDGEKQARKHCRTLHAARRRCYVTWMQARARHVCPICARDVAPRGENAAYPFCSSACKLVDLGRWFDGTYHVPGPRVAEDDVEEEK